MPLAPGTWLAHYEILGHLGSGGMGDVYHARDNKLQREVALKVLPEHFARDPERIARFRREAQLLAQLNHPNIAILYNFEETGETRFLVMELVLGETLRERIKRGPLPLEEALEICSQITEALEHAHEKPIIHRDLKPANVKVTPQGQVKVLDFGLAKAFGADTANIDPHDAPTGSLAGTLKGTILGTPAYMSPEQARGKETDKRTDIWALGCVLYELLTGKWVFQSRDPRQAGAGREGAGPPLDTVQDIIAKVLEREPDWTALPETTPPWVRSMLRRCLEKDLKRRFRDAADVRIAIEEAPSTALTPAVPLPAAAPVVPTRAIRRQAMVVGLACLLVGSIITGIAVWNWKPTQPPPPVARFAITLPPNDRLAVQGVQAGVGVPSRAVTLSPDGTQLAYAAVRGGAQQIYLRPINSLEAKPISGTEGGYLPFFSPDGQWLGFFAGGKLKKVSVSGGPPVTLCDAPLPGGASWGANDVIAFSPNAGGGLMQVPGGGGTPQTLTTVDSKQKEFAHRWPEILPGGKAVLFTAGSTIVLGNSSQIVAQSLETGERRVLVQGGTDAHYLPPGPSSRQGGIPSTSLPSTALRTGRAGRTGHLVFSRAGTLMAVSFDLARLEVTGSPVPLVEGIAQDSASGAAQFAISHTGSLVYITGTSQGAERTLIWVDRKGIAQPLAAPPRDYKFPRLSPDGRVVAVQINSPSADVWLYDVSRETLTRFTFEGSNSQPVWTPDGKRVAFQSPKAGAPNIFWKLADGSGPVERLTTSEYTHAPLSWSPDGELLAFVEVHPKTLTDIWVLPIGGDPSAGSLRLGSGQAGQGRKPRPFLQTPFIESAPMISPDGHWLAYSSDESGRTEVYVQTFPTPGGKWQISSEGGVEPTWARSGKELFYRAGDKMMAVDVNPSRDPRQAGAGREGAVPSPTAFAAGKPRLLFEGRYDPSAITRPNYDVTPDGQRFLMLKPTEQAAAPTQINVVLNWFEELKKRVPSGR